MTEDERRRELARRAADDYSAALVLVALHEESLGDDAGKALSGALARIFASGEEGRDGALDAAYEVLRLEFDRRARAALSRARITARADRNAALNTLMDAMEHVGPGHVSDVGTACEVIIASGEEFDDDRFEDEEARERFLVFARDLLARRALEIALEDPEFVRRHPRIVERRGPTMAGIESFLGGLGRILDDAGAILRTPVQLALGDASIEIREQRADWIEAYAHGQRITPLAGAAAPGAGRRRRRAPSLEEVEESLGIIARYLAANRAFFPVLPIEVAIRGMPVLIERQGNDGIEARAGGRIVRGHGIRHT